MREEVWKVFHREPRRRGGLLETRQPNQVDTLLAARPAASCPVGGGAASASPAGPSSLPRWPTGAPSPSTPGPASAQPPRRGRSPGPTPELRAPLFRASERSSGTSRPGGEPGTTGDLRRRAPALTAGQGQPGREGAQGPLRAGPGSSGQDRPSRGRHPENTARLPPAEPPPPEKQSGEAVDEDDGWTEDMQRLQEEQLRAELLEQYQTLLMERSSYQRYNLYLQHKISEALRKKKGLEAAEVPDKGPEPEAPEKEQAYLHHLAMLEELKKQGTDDLDWYHQELSQLKEQCREELSRVEKEWRGFQALKKQVVMQAMGSCRMRGGRQAALREVEQIQALEDKKEKEMSAVRLENVQLKQSLMHFETRMRAQEDLTEGLLLIDFEQLKIENQTFNEKVEERNEELLKLHNKVTNNVQIITHVKEKLHFVDVENACKKTQLLEIEARVALRRDILTRTKQARDCLRVDNTKLNQKCGLLGKELLLRDMEEKVDKTELLKQRLESLKRRHAGLTMSCRGVKQKIREAKAFLPS
eukprot:XP_022271984.1 coiled-coil domain-containing protein 96 [Canis lupus familiaris]